MAQLQKSTKRVIVTSESVNSYRFRVLTDGIDINQYEKNPVMLWMHIRAIGNAKDIILPLGNVIELRREDHPEFGKVITGLPVFDLSDEFAKRIFEKYENGTIRMASAGLLPLDWSDEPQHLLAGQGGATLIKSVLQEISLCDIGGNDDAVQVALYNDANERIELSLKGDNAIIPQIKNPLIEKEMLKIELTADKAAVMLGLKEIGTAEQFEQKVAEVVQLAASQKTQIETLTREKTEEAEKVVKLTKDLNDATALANTAKIESLVQLAVDARKITADEKATYIKLAAADFTSVETLLNAKAGAPLVQDTLDKSVKLNAEAFVGKTWAELDKAGKLVQLKAANRPLFDQLFEAQFNKKYEEAK